MRPEIEEIARLMGAKIVGSAPGGGGAFGAARLASLFHARMNAVREEGQLTAGASELRPSVAVAISEPTVQALSQLAASMSTPEGAVSAQQMATLILEEIRVLVTTLGGQQVAELLAYLHEMSTAAQQRRPSAR